MKLAVMQPYFFPYIGYWQLIHAADYLVLLDDVQYMRFGWINRNRILKPGGGWQYILAPIRKHSMSEPIKNIQVHPEKNWKNRIIAQLAHYKKKARYFDETRELVKEALFGNSKQDIVAINYAIIEKLCAHLNIESKIIVSSRQGFDYTNVNGAGEWALRIAEQMNAQEYINPISGTNLFDPEKFRSSKIKLSFLKSNEISYEQGSTFEPSLSIIDVMMFNGQTETQTLLDKYSIVAAL